MADYLLQLRPMPGSKLPPDIIRLRRVLKCLSRTWGMRAVSVSEIDPATISASRPDAGEAKGEPVPGIVASASCSPAVRLQDVGGDKVALHG